jgi:hypothetical protein
MSEQAGNNNPRNEELDLIDIFRRLGNSLSKFGKFVGHSLMILIVFLLRKWIPLAISIIIGIVISYSLKSASKSFYTSDIVFRNNLSIIDKLKPIDNSGTTSDLIAKINKLHTFCVEKNWSGLASSLHMMSDSVNNISDVSAYWIIDQSKDGIPDYVDYKGNHSAYDTLNIRMPDRFDIRVKINSSVNLNSIRDGILKFINNDSLFQQRNRLRLKQNHDMLSRLNYDILQLDSLQKVKYFEETRNVKPASGGQIIFMQEQKTQLVYNDIYYLYDKKQKLEEERDLYKNIVTSISDFSQPSKRENGAMYYGETVIPVTFSITLIILILLANRKKIKEIFEKY